MASIAVDRTTTPRIGAIHGLRRVGLVVAGIAAFWGLWEGYRWLGETVGITWPFTVDATNMPHIHDMLHALIEPLQPDGPPLIQLELALGALHGEGGARSASCSAGSSASLLAVLLAHSVLLRRGVLPYIVVSQTVPILAIAPMVVVGLGTKGVTPWVSVAVIAAYLTFFPVTINTLRGLLSPDPRALELMRSYAADRRGDPLEAARAGVAAVRLHGAQDRGDRERDRRDHRRDAGLDPGRPRRRDRQLQPVLLDRARALWATNIVCAVLGIAFFGAVVLVEHFVVRRAPEHVA